jgi:hypothetical protein
MDTKDTHVDEAGEHDGFRGATTGESEWVATFKAMSTTAVVLGAT